MLNEIRPGNHLLRVQVYDYLQEQMRMGALEPGASISVNTMIDELGVSRTPLREALLLLQEQGFVSIQPQRGVKINVLTMDDVKDIYEILGGIESRVILSVFDKISKREIDLMKKLNLTIEAALKNQDIIRHNQANIEFHDVFLNLSENHRLLRYVNNLKMQLYDFPKRDYGSQWNLKNLHEHKMFVQLVEDCKPIDAENYMRDIHWGFERPDSFITIPNN
jgi:DNA-binding GntR family transcriptional regulator